MSFKDPIKNRASSKASYQKCRKKRIAYQKNYYQENKKSVLAYHQTYYQKNKERIRSNQRRYKQKLRLNCIKAYGGECACCGETAIEFLAIDHENGEGGGVSHRREVTGSQKPSSTQFFMWLRNNDYPPGFRVLCHNCNMSRSLYGYCPHENKP